MLSRVTARAYRLAVRMSVAFFVLWSSKFRYGCIFLSNSHVFIFPSHFVDLQNHILKPLLGPPKSLFEGFMSQPTKKQISQKLIL